MTKAAAAVFAVVVLLLPGAALASEIEDYISAWQELFQKYESGNLTYMEARLDGWELDKKSIGISENEIKLLDMEEVSSETSGIGGPGRFNKKDFRELISSSKRFNKNVFDGKRAYGNLTAQIATYRMVKEDGTEDIETESKAYMVSWDLAKPVKVVELVDGKAVITGTPDEDTPRRLVEKSFPGFARTICERNIMDEYRLKKVLMEIKRVNKIPLEFDPNYGFRHINDSYSMEDAFKECDISIVEDGRDELKLYKCSGELTGTYFRHAIPECQEEVMAKYPVPRMHVKVKMKKAGLEMGFERAWGKMKEASVKSSQAEFLKPKAAEKMEGLIGKPNYTISTKIYNATMTSLFETTLYMAGGQLVGIKPEFFANGDLRIKIKSDALYDLYSMNLALDRDLSENQEETIRRVFLGGVRTIIGIFKAGVSGDISIEPFWNLGKLKGALDKTMAFQSCTEEFFMKNETALPQELQNCYAVLK